MQVQQMQHIQVANMQATQLAVQLASLRAIAKTTLLPAIKEEERQEHTGGQHDAGPRVCLSLKHSVLAGVHQCLHLPVFWLYGQDKS